VDSILNRQASSAERPRPKQEWLAPGVLYNDLKACNDYSGGFESAAKLQCPALFILGRRDVMTPPKASRGLSQALKNSEIVTLESSGHSLMAEAPDAVLDSLIAFLGSGS